jgi:DNA-binding transcriptional LysR family regulator
MAAIIDFMALHPKVNIDVDLQDNTLDLVEKRIDLAIRIASAPDPSLIGKPIAQCRSALVAKPEYLGNSPKIKSPQDLIGHQCLGNKNFECHVWHLNQADDFRPIEVNCRLNVNDTTALMKAVLSGGGISMLPTYLVNPRIKTGELVQVLSQWQLPEMDILVLYPSRKHLSANVRALIDFLSDYFQKHHWE